MSACDLLLTADWLWTGETMVRHAAMAVREGRIVHLGDSAATEQLVEREGGARTTRRLGEALLLPGLVNAHTHAPMTLLRGAGDDMPLLDWLEQRIWPLEAQLSPELVYTGALLACAEMTAAGVTTFADMYLWSNEVARAVELAGMRAVLAEGQLGFPTRTYRCVEEGLALATELIHRFKNHPRIDFAMAPHTAFTTTPEQLRATHAAAVELDVPWMIHAAESTAETAACMEKHGQRPIPYLESLGCLDERAVLVHGVDVTPQEIARIAACGCAVVHCPHSNMKLASGFAPVQAYLEAGVPLALGTDGAASNNRLDLLADLGAAALLAKVRERDPTALPARQALAMATTAGAQALRLPSSGLAPGAPADCCALDLTAPHLQPVHDPLSHAVYAAGGGDVILTVVAGEILYDNGVFTRIDLDALRAAAAEAQRFFATRRGAGTG